jgi:hypothetical protein
MLNGMTAKIAISLPDEIVAHARAEVRKRAATSVSAWMAKAARAQAMADDLDAMLQEMLAETGGPLTAAEKRWADKVWSGKGPVPPPPPRPRRRKRT